MSRSVPLSGLVSALAFFLMASLAGCGEAPLVPAESEPTGAQATTVASAVRFDATNKEVLAYAHTNGWDKTGSRIAVSSGDLVYTTDSWHTTKTATIQYLLSGNQGFLIRDLAAGTSVEYAVHAYVCASYDGFRSCYDRGDMWANNGGKNYRAATTDSSGK